MSEHIYIIWGPGLHTSSPSPAHLHCCLMVGAGAGAGVLSPVVGGGALGCYEHGDLALPNSARITIDPHGPTVTWPHVIKNCT